MKHDVLEQLADTEIPPVPREFDRSVHDRLNTLLVVEHLFDLLMRGVPYALGHFAEAVGAFVAASLSDPSRSETRRPPES